MNNSTLMLHAGASEVDVKELELVRVPDKTDSWVPIPHIEFVNQVRFVLNEYGYPVAKERHALGREGLRYFGIFDLEQNAVNNDSQLSIGLRNSNDKSYPVGLAAGERVFVCDNLSFNGEVNVSRKHTVNLLRDLPQLLGGAIAKLNEFWRKQEEQVTAYKAFELNRLQVDHLIVQSYQVGVITSHQIMPVIKEWEQPRHEEFSEPTAWRFFNGVTEILKDISPFVLPSRTVKLHHLLDAFVKFGNN